MLPLAISVLDELIVASRATAGCAGAVSLERRVVLLSRDTGLASIVGLALANGDRVAQIRSTAELADWSEETVAAVVLDSRPQSHQLRYKQVRDRWRGPLVMLLERGERRPNLPPDGARRFLYRPFSAADFTAVLATPPPQLGVVETAVIDAWSRHARPDAPAKRPEGLSYRASWGPSARRRLRAWAWTVAAMMGLLLVFNVSDQRPCGQDCASFGAVAGASESRAPLTPRPPSRSGGGSGGGRTGQSTTPAAPEPGGPAGVPLVSGIGGLIESINPITATDPTPPAAPKPVPGVPSPAPPPTTGPPPTTPTPTTGPTPTTAPPTTAPPTTAPPTTAPPTTAPPTTEPPTTAPPTTAPTTEPPTTAPPTTEPPTTAPPTTTAPAATTT
jgi:hypothetical protein